MFCLSESIIDGFIACLVYVDYLVISSYFIFVVTEKHRMLDLCCFKMVLASQTVDQY